MQTLARKFGLALTLSVALNVHVAQAQHACRQALVLALDVSGSVNPTEYAQQIDGLATALNDPHIRSLILDGADAPIHLAVFEWSSRNHQYVIQPWTTIDSPGALDRAILRIRSHRKVRAGLKTALGSALTFAAALLEQRPNCWRRTIDVSGDGVNNIGATPQQTYRLPAFRNITVNALVVGTPYEGTVEGAGLTPEALQSYYDAEVLHGSDAFSMRAEGYGDYDRAMRRKLEKELELPSLGQVGPSRIMQ